MMDKSILEKRIRDKAEERADEYFEEISDFFLSHQELYSNGNEGLVIKNIGGKDISFRSPYRNSLFDSQKNLSKYTNWQDVRKELVEKYEKEETDNILSRLESIDYLKGDKYCYYRKLRTM